MAILPVGIGPQEGGYQIERSLRFNSADSAYLSRTPASAGNRKTWTWSAWVKRGKLGTTQIIFESNPTGVLNTTRWLCFFNGSDNIQIDGAANIFRTTNAVFRDPSAWYHVVVVCDTPNATVGNRILIYVNGVSQSFSTSAAITQNDDLAVNATFPHYIGYYDGSTLFYDGYQTEVNFIDGQALDPTSFGEYNSETGVWQPKAYSGSYGTNGFYLDFADNSSTTALGYDAAGSNDWTPNNFSVTAGAGNDSLVDTPTPYGTDTGAGGEVRGNYATLNPLDKNSGITLSNGNLDASMPTQVQNVYGTVSVTSGKWYWETTINSMSGRLIIGVGNAVDQSWNLDPALSSALWGYYSVNGNKLNGSNIAYGNSFTANDVIGVAVDMDSGKIWFSKNGTWQASGDPAAGTNAAFTNLTGSVRPMYDQQLTNAVTISCNFGQRPFAYAAPTGFKALCTQNLPDPAIADGSTAMNVVLWNGATTGTSLDVTGYGFQPDLIWTKTRNNAYGHFLQDVVRGVGVGNQNTLSSNTTAAEADTAGYAQSFLSDGFNVSTANGTSAGNTLVTWGWKAGGTGVTNTAGTINSTVSANTTAGFSIVTYTGTGTAGTIGHGLGVAPSMIIAKRRDSGATPWVIYHISMGAANYMAFDTSAQSSTTAWNSTTPTSSVFSLGANVSVNNSTSPQLAYCFAPVEGFSAFGSYVGNGSADGPFVYTGFRPKYLLIKSSSASATNWVVQDTTRFTYNLVDDGILANTSAAEYSSGYDVDILSNGFKIRRSGGDTNASSATYIYAAFAENPFKFSLAR